MFFLALSQPLLEFPFWLHFYYSPFQCWYSLGSVQVPLIFSLFLISLIHSFLNLIFNFFFFYYFLLAKVSKVSVSYPNPTLSSWSSDQYIQLLTKYLQLTLPQNLRSACLQLKSYPVLQHAIPLWSSSRLIVLSCSSWKYGCYRVHSPFPLLWYLPNSKGLFLFFMSKFIYFSPFT